MWWGFVAAWTAVVCTFSLSRGSVVGDWLRMMLRWWRKAGVGRPHETLYHLLGFVVLGALVGIALSRSRKLMRGAWWAGALGAMLVLGALVEGLQVFVPARTPSLFDFGGNALGALLGLSAVTGVQALRRGGAARGNGA